VANTRLWVQSPVPIKKKKKKEKGKMNAAFQDQIPRHRE
jgi:hypothetical protein